MNTTAEDDPEHRATSRTTRFHPVAKFAIGLALGVVAVWLVVSTAGGLGDAAAAMGRMRGGFVVLAFGFAAVRLMLFGLQLLWLGRRTGPMGLMTASGLALIIFGLGAITPAAPAEGLVIASRELGLRGRTKRQARVTVGFSEWFAQRTFYAIAALDLILVVALGHLSVADSWPFIIVAAVVLLAIIGSAIAARRSSTAEWLASTLGALRLRKPQGPAEDRRDAAAVWHAEAMAIVGPPRNRLRLAIVSAAAVLADAATLWATCHAAGFHIHPELVLLARTVGAIASWIPLLPSGLGVVEIAIPAILHRFGAPLEDALAATLIYRAAGTLLPAVAGGLALVALRAHRHPTTLTAQEQTA
ncbi:hypothetical protein BH10ACT2_BH10ACT2_24890 [soil metagenome]